MADPINIHRFEIQHIFPSELFSDNSIIRFLASIGITKEMKGNKIALLADSDMVADFAGAPTV